MHAAHDSRRSWPTWCRRKLMARLSAGSSAARLPWAPTRPVVPPVVRGCGRIYRRAGRFVHGATTASKVPRFGNVDDRAQPTDVTRMPSMLHDLGIGRARTVHDHTVLGALPPTRARPIVCTSRRPDSDDGQSVHDAPPTSVGYNDRRVAPGLRDGGTRQGTAQSHPGGPTRSVLRKRPADTRCLRPRARRHRACCCRVSYAGSTQVCARISQIRVWGSSVMRPVCWSGSPGAAARARLVVQLHEDRPDRGGEDASARPCCARTGFVDRARRAGAVATSGRVAGDSGATGDAAARERRRAAPLWGAALRAVLVLLVDLGHRAGADGAATLTDGEAQALFHGDRLDQLDASSRWCRRA